MRKLGTDPFFCCTQYICRNESARITISYICHRKHRSKKNSEKLFCLL